MSELDDKPSGEGEQPSVEAGVSPMHNQGGADEDDIPYLEGSVEEQQQNEEESHPVELRDVASQDARHRALADLGEDASELSSGGPSSVGISVPRIQSPAESMMSGGPDDTPSLPASVAGSPGSSLVPSMALRPGFRSPTPSFKPFDRRFQSRIASPSVQSPRSLSLGFIQSHSRNGSTSSNFAFDQLETDNTTPPWEVVRWTRLLKLNGQAFSEAGRRNFGSPTCLVISASIVLGTTKGIILIFDYNQNLKMILGPGTKAVESGPITAVAVSADHTTVAGGHANGNIFTWDTNRASRPFLTIQHLDPSQFDRGRTEDGHVPHIPIRHLGFLGTRHTALVSADERGMAFSHLATRGTGALGRTVKTTRILGRYPDAPLPTGKPVKPSTVLAFGPLPLGNAERATDTMGLTAMLTPYLLVIVSTTPVAQTQHKSARPKDVPAHSAMTGCLSWFPAVKLKVPDASTGSEISRAKLVYCWSNVLTVLDVDETPGEHKDEPSTLRFKARSRWKCEEPIAAVQWLSRSVLTVLTLSQRLIVLEDRTMRMTESFDLLQRHIYHSDLFSKQLHSLVEQPDEEYESMHGVVGDAFYMSFKAYKGRIFLLGFNEVSIGALSNWADRLIAIMEHGDYIGAIKLATSYDTGDADKLTVGLPEDAVLRHSMVRGKIVEIMSASLKFVFGQLKKGENVDNQHLKLLVETCFSACESIQDNDFLFEEVYEWYEDSDVQGLFLEVLEPYILGQTITVVPPGVIKDMVSHYVQKGWEGRLEEILCHMNTATLDLDQTTLLCKQHGLYDALTYIWNQALGDYITPMIDLLALLVSFLAGGDTGGNIGDDDHGVNALKLFPYLSYSLTGRVYPRGESMDEATATKAKAEIYWFLFSGKTIAWPKGSNKEFLTRPVGEHQLGFPYLRLILKFDAPSLLSALNEAFEDSFLNDTPEKHTDTYRMDLPEEQVFGQTINRQYIVSILLDVMNSSEFGTEDTIYLDMFVARNLPKFPQYLLFSGSTLTKVLTGLCEYPGEDLADDAQLSAEYLLSVYQPPDMPSFMPLFKKAGFYRILKRVYKVGKQYDRLVEMYFEDPEEQESVFECISDCLRPNSGLTERQLGSVLGVIKSHAQDLLELSPERSASTLALQPKVLHEHIVASASDAEGMQHAYLKSLLESGDQESPDRDLVERYVQLMCRFEPSHVSDYVGIVQSTNLRLERLLPTMEETGVIDAAVVLMAQDGQVKQGMERLVKHLHTLESALQGLLTGSEEADNEMDIQVAAEELLQSLQNYVHVGIWLCKGQMKSSKKVKVVQKKKKAHQDLTLDEALWLSLIEACVQITRRLSPALTAAVDTSDNEGEVDGEKLIGLLRSLVQHTFTSLLTATSSHATDRATPKLLSNTGSNMSFLRILRAFLTQAAAASPNLADLRGVLASIFAAYAYEESILGLSNRLLERSLYLNVSQAAELRQRGWRPRGSTCEACGRRVWGPGVPGSAVFEAWENKQAIEDGKRKDKKTQMVDQDQATGKGKSLDTRPKQDVEAPAGGKPLGSLVVLACRHIYHQSCLDALQDKQEGEGRQDVVGRLYKCPVDG